MYIPMTTLSNARIFTDNNCFPAIAENKKFTKLQKEKELDGNVSQKMSIKLGAWEEGMFLK